MPCKKTQARHVVKKVRCVYCFTERTIIAHTSLQPHEIGASGRETHAHHTDFRKLFCSLLNIPDPLF